MKVLVSYDNGTSYGEFEYFSKYNRINAMGIKEEAKQKMVDKFGSHAKYYEIISMSRV